MDKRIGQLRCGECEAVFNNQSSLSRHEKIHWVALRCARDGCEKAFSSSKHLAKHLKRHSDTNITIRIVPFNIQTKIEAMEELSDGASRQQSVQQLKNIKKKEEGAELRVKIEVKDEHDQTAEKEIDRSNGQTVRGCVKKCVKKEDKENDDYCGCKECISEKVTSDDDRVLSGTSLPPTHSADGHFGTRHSQIVLDGDTPSNSTSLHELIGGEKLDTKLWLRGVIDGLEDTMIDSLFFRLIMSSSTASIPPQRSSTVLKLCQLIEGQTEKTNKLLRIDMDRIINLLFLRLTNKALVNFDWAGSRYVGYRSQVVNLSDQVESPNAQSLQQPFRITQPSTSMFEQRSFTSSFNSHQTHVSELMFQLITAERVDLKLWLRGEMERLADLTIDSLFFRLIMSSSSATSVSPQRCSTVPELCQLMEGEEKKMNNSLRKEIDRLVNSLLERLKNKLLVRTAGSENVYHRSQVNLLNNVESANPESHQPSSSILQSSSSTFIIDELEPVFIGEIEEGNLEVLKYVPHYTSNANQQSEQLIELDGQDQSYQDGHIALSHKINSNSSSTNDHNNTNDEGLENQTIQDDQQPNGQVNNAIDTQQNWDKLEIEEKGDDEQMMDIEEKEKGDEVEDEENENDSDNCEEYENNRDDKSSRFVVSNPSSVMIQSARLPKCNVQLCKRVKIEENDEGETWDGDECYCDECRVERMIKQENDQTGEKEIDGNNGQANRDCVKDKKEEEEYDGKVNIEVKRPNKKQRIDKMTEEEDPVPLETSKLLHTVQSSTDTGLEDDRVDQIDETDDQNDDGEVLANGQIDDEVADGEDEDHNDDDTEVDEDYDENYEKSGDELLENEQMDDGEVDEEDEDTEIDEESEQIEGKQEHSIVISNKHQKNVSDVQQHQLHAKSFVKRIEPDELGNRFECDYEGCGLRYKQSYSLIRHIRRHTGEMPFKCSWNNCCRTFIRKDTLNEHFNSHTGKCLFVCTWPSCNARFKQSSNLRRHNRRHLNDRRHRCDWPDCVKTFIDSYSLKIHRITHTGERPHKCDWPGCVQAFSDSSNLKVHRRLHTKERPFACNQCGVAYAQKKNLNAHYCRKRSH